MNQLVENLIQTSRKIPIIFPMHPRTRNNLERLEKLNALEQEPSIHIVEPLGYLEFVSLVGGSTLVITDSGGPRGNHVSWNPLFDTKRKYRTTNHDFGRDESPNFGLVHSTNVGG